jgi:uncharacterized protein Yka (UPF0111/DUF47 family)
VTTSIGKIFENSNDPKFVELIKRHVQTSVACAEKLDMLFHALCEPPLAGSYMEDIVKLERGGDEIVAEVRELLDKVFILKKFEKENIAELTSTLDDVLDNMRDAATLALGYDLNSVREEAPQFIMIIKSMLDVLLDLSGNMLMLTPEEIAKARRSLQDFERSADVLRLKARKRLTQEFRARSHSDSADRELFLMYAWEKIDTKLERVTDRAANALDILASMVRKY